MKVLQQINKWKKKVIGLECYHFAAPGEFMDLGIKHQRSLTQQKGINETLPPPESRPLRPLWSCQRGGA